ncbi:hypothetical protein DXG01_003007 [Tephrocybe rancida]|nr:hypothetical protein DXG01_003007 [Tephrocybe rancida]
MCEINQKTLCETPTAILEPGNESQVVDGLVVAKKVTAAPPDKLAKSSIIEPVTVSNGTTTELEPYGARSAPQGASQEMNVQKPLSYFPRLKSALRAVKEYMCLKRGNGDRTYRRGVYTFLYGGRVNVNTFYDYMCQEMY